MAAARRLLSTWFSTNIKITEQMGQTKYRSAFSAGIASCFSGISKEMQYLRGQSTPCLSFGHKNFGGKSFNLFAETGNHQIANLKRYKTIRTLDRRWITTSASYLNQESSTSSGKIKIKERIEKVKETVHVS